MCPSTAQIPVDRTNPLLFLVLDPPLKSHTTNPPLHSARNSSPHLPRTTVPPSSNARNRNPQTHSKEPPYHLAEYPSSPQAADFHPALVRIPGGEVHVRIPMVGENFPYLLFPPQNYLRPLDYRQFLPDYRRFLPSSWLRYWSPCWGDVVWVGHSERTLKGRRCELSRGTVWE